LGERLGAMETLDLGSLREFYDGKRVLITGHTGFKGSWLSYVLTRLGARVGGYSDRVPTQPSLFEVLRLDRDMDHNLGDVRDLGDVTRFISGQRPQVVFHLAAQPLVLPSYGDPVGTFGTNSVGTLNVLEAIRGVDSISSVVVVTTDKVYRNVGRDSGYVETDSLGGKDPYSASKACAEIIFRSYAQSFFGAPEAPAIASVRAGNVIGGGDWADHRIVPDCVREWSQGDPVRLRNPKAVRPWQHVLEPTAAYLWVGRELTRNPQEHRGQSYNIGPDERDARQVEDLVETMRTHWPRADWRLVEGAAAGAEDKLLTLNCDKARQKLKWENTLTFEECVRFSAQWYRSFYEKSADILELTREQLVEYHALARQRGRAWAAASGAA
jgi:CDP-glucose 4,6-dehydratase